MDTRPRVRIFAPQKKNLSKVQNAFRAALEKRLAETGVAVIADGREGANLAKDYNTICDTDGVVILAFEQWAGRRCAGNQQDEAVLPSEFTHISIVQSAIAKRPYLILREKSLSSRGALRNGFAGTPVNMPKSLDTVWLRSPEFSNDLDDFLKQVHARYHVFLGYSSQASDVANLLLRFLTEKLKLRVYDWHNFPPGHSVWEAIEDAERSTNCGIFLFMEDDAVGDGKNKKLAPRDNVIFEAGYFAGAKRRSRALVIREKEAKMPTDFGGILYLELADRKNIATIETRLAEHLQRMLNDGD